MSRLYEMQVEITGWDSLRKEDIKQAARLQWPFEDWLPWEDRLIAAAEGSLCGGEREEEFARRLAHTIWQANGTFCLVEVRATYLEELPHEFYIFEEEDHDEFLKTGDPSAQTQEDSNHGAAEDEPDIP